ncbi:DNA-binding protein [Rhodothermus marinus]|jgi:predicted transcriptional regulator|uniref:DNA-binding protein n=1 Tax=Rhodothermus marinus TaxID=29549 RepID=UPI000223DC57|nr:DNA-binding protein [Rhodothermus marinus]AEN73172.1 hypothetical protein Rhom172_1245 [Rhodothermus marinus SG0.5JP17-172]MBO2491919.1 DNA-binding protein [Rhodothermus marinus]BBM69862.1 hypothetical protein RmaAA213_17080 [Rhodothermus marinus]BBM72848.1 hypothetical protein RmaAA338_17130 [Rhodothermus marinus]
MVRLTITLSDAVFAQLEEKARRYQLTPETLLQKSLEDWLALPDESFERAMARVLEKNAELYRRLAQR